MFCYQEFKVLEARDEELTLLRDGKLKATHKHRTSKVMRAVKKEAFQRYLSLFYNRPDIVYPADDLAEEDGEDEPFAVKMDYSYQPPILDEGFFGIQSSLANVKKVKASLRKKREAAVERKKEAARILAGEPKARESRSLSITASTVVDEFNKREETRNRPTLSASTTYVERLKAMKKERGERGEGFRFCAEKLEQIEACASTEYPKNENSTRAVNKQIIARLEQTANAHAPKQDMLPVAPDGFIPNSVVAALYRELRRESDQSNKTRIFSSKWAPRQLTEDQLGEIDCLQNNVCRFFIRNLLYKYAL